MANVLTYGTFDLFHIGHLRLLERAKSLGDKLIVGVSTDEFNAKKGKRSFIPYAHRVEIVSKIKCVDQVIPEEDWEQKTRDIKKYKIDTFCMGDDWKGKFDFLKDQCKVVYIDRTSDIDSTGLRSLSRAFDKDALLKLAEAHSIIDELLARLNGD
jgi:glycerol-3-phosphate cytidylyltransferase